MTIIPTEQEWKSGIVLLKDVWELRFFTQLNIVYMAKSLPKQIMSAGRKPKDQNQSDELERLAASLYIPGIPRFPPPILTIPDDATCSWLLATRYSSMIQSALGELLSKARSKNDRTVLTSILCLLLLDHHFRGVPSEWLEPERSTVHIPGWSVTFIPGKEPVRTENKPTTFHPAECEDNSPGSEWRMVRRVRRWVANMKIRPMTDRREKITSSAVTQFFTLHVASCANRSPTLIKAEDIFADILGDQRVSVQNKMERDTNVRKLRQWHRGRLPDEGWVCGFRADWSEIPNKHDFWLPENECLPLRKTSAYPYRLGLPSSHGIGSEKAVWMERYRQARLWSRIQRLVVGIKTNAAATVISELMSIDPFAVDSRLDELRLIQQRLGIVDRTDSSADK